MKGVDFALFQVLGNGELLEFDTPSTLLSRSNSYFSELVEQTGPAEAEYLRALANPRSSKMKKKNQETTSDDEVIPPSNENDPLLV